MTSFENPQAIQHFHSLCDACQDLRNRSYENSILMIYCEGYFQSLRKTKSLEPRDQVKLEKIMEDWIYNGGGI